jgi:hypothetical protein
MGGVSIEDDEGDEEDEDEVYDDDEVIAGDQLVRRGGLHPDLDSVGLGSARLLPGGDLALFLQVRLV